MRRLIVGGIWIVGALALLWIVAVSTLGLDTLLRMSRQSVADITIENRSTDLITRGQIEVLGDMYPFSSIAVGESTHVSFPIRGEGEYRIRAWLASGDEVSSREGRYVTWGLRVVDRAEVTNEMVEVQPAP